MPKKYLKLSNLKCLVVCFVVLSSNMAIAGINPYFSKDKIDPTQIDPPFNSESQEFKNEIEEILEFQRNLNPDELKAARTERHLKPEMIGEAEYPKLTRQKYPHLYHLLDRSKDTASMAVWKSKDYWNAKRPYQVDKRVKILMPTSGSSAYPSGHTTKSYVVAHVLSLVMPKRVNRFKARAATLSQHRVIVGLHFPRDLKGGVKLSRIVIENMLESDEFLDDFNRAKEELKNKPFI